MTDHDSSWDADDDSDFVSLEDGRASITDPAPADENGQVPTVMFTVANPRGTVSATATLGGRLHQVDLTRNATDMTEAELAEEITTLAALASQKAQAAQHAVIVELMRSMGHDRVTTSGFLEHTVGLPSPSTAEARTAEVFATRYTLEED